MRPRFLSCVPRPLLVLRVIVGLSASFLRRSVIACFTEALFAGKER